MWAMQSHRDLNEDVSLRTVSIIRKATTKFPEDRNQRRFSNFEQCRPSNSIRMSERVEGRLKAWMITSLATICCKVFDMSIQIAELVPNKHVLVLSESWLNKNIRIWIHLNQLSEYSDWFSHRNSFVQAQRGCSGFIGFLLSTTKSLCKYICTI